MDRERLAGNLERVRRRITEACGRVGRSEEEVLLIAVTKSVGVEEINLLIGLGVRDFGENRVAELRSKVNDIAEPDVRWHFIGHLQRNKARQILPCCCCLHSVESLKLVDVLQAQASKHEGRLEVLVEVNVSGEPSKYGIREEDLGEMVERIEAADALGFRGLMTMAPWNTHVEAARPVFRRLHELGEQLQSSCSAEELDYSMGMSRDLEVAVEEGATMVRVGSDLFA